MDYVETKALVAALEGDDDQLDSILKGCFPTELNALRIACNTVSNACARELVAHQEASRD